MLLLSNLLLNSVHSTWRHFSCSWPCFLPTFTTYHQIVFSKPKLPTTVSLFQALLHMDVSSHEVSTPSLAQKFSVVLHNLKQSKLLHIFPLHSFPQLYAALSSLGCTLLLNTPYTRLPPLGSCLAYSCSLECPAPACQWPTHASKPPHFLFTLLDFTTLLPSLLEVNLTC